MLFSTMNTLRTLAVATMLGISALAAVPAYAEDHDASFRATLSEQFAPSACPATAPAGTLCIQVTGTGRATHLGHATEMGLGMVNPAAIDPQTGCAPDSSDTTLTGAHGDQLFLHTSGTF